MKKVTVQTALTGFYQVLYTQKLGWGIFWSRCSNAAKAMVVHAAMINESLPDGGNQWLHQKPYSPSFDNSCSGGGDETVPQKICIN